jgi:hypothetical protein
MQIRRKLKLQTSNISEYLPGVGIKLATISKSITGHPDDPKMLPHS